MADRYDYKTAGFDEFLHKGIETEEEKTEDESSYKITQLTGTSIASGITKSSSEKMVADWNDDELYVSDGARKRVQIGNFDKTGIYGLRVLDSSGNVRFESSNSKNYLGMIGNQVTVSSSGGDFTDIQEAINYIYKLGGGTVFIKQGNYTPTGNIYVPGLTHLIGETQENVLITFDSGCGFVLGYESNGVVSDTISNFEIKNLTFSNDGTGDAIFTDLRILDIIIDNVDVDCDDFLSTDSKVLTISDLVIKDSSIACESHFLYGINTTIENCFITNNVISCGQVAIQIHDISDTNISSNEISGYGIIYLYTSIYISFIYNNEFESDGNQVISAGSLYWSNISGNICRTTDGNYGFSFTSGWESSISNNILDNNEAVNSITGMSLNNCDRLTITGNIVTDYLVGCVLDNQCDRCTIVANVFTSNDTNFTNNATNSQATANVTT